MYYTIQVYIVPLSYNYQMSSQDSPIYKYIPTYIHIYTHTHIHIYMELANADYPAPSGILRNHVTLSQNLSYGMVPERLARRCVKRQFCNLTCVKCVTVADPIENKDSLAGVTIMKRNLSHRNSNDAIPGLDAIVQLWSDNFLGFIFNGSAHTVGEQESYRTYFNENVANRHFLPP